MKAVSFHFKGFLFCVALVFSFSSCSSCTGNGTEDGSSGDETPPTATLNLPSFGPSGGASVSVTFSEAMEADTISGATFTVTSSDGTVLCGEGVGAVSYNEATHVATCEAVFSGCGDLEEYTATLSTDIRDEAGNPLAETVFSFTGADDGFENSETDSGGCWFETSNDGDSFATIDIDTTNEGRWTLQSTDTATPPDGVVLYIKSIPGDFSVLMKLDTLSFGFGSNGDNQFGLFLSGQPPDDDDPDASADMAVPFFTSAGDLIVLSPFVSVNGEQSQGSPVITCDGCLSTTPVYLCLQRTGNSVSGGYSEDGQTFRDIDFPVSELDLGAEVLVGFLFKDGMADPDITATVDYIRFSTDSTSCPDPL